MIFFQRIFNLIQLFYYKYFYGYLYKLEIHNGNITLGLGVRYFGHKFKKNNDKDASVGKLYKKEDVEDLDYTHHYILPYGNNFLEYKNCKLLVVVNNRNETLDELAFSYLNKCDIEIYLLNKKTSKSNQQIIKEFVKEGAEYYEEHILDKDTESDLVKSYIYEDNYWETLNKRSKRKLDSVHLGDIGKNLLSYIKNFLKPETKKKYHDKGIPYKKNILLEGLPGTGKTSLVFAIASELKKNIAYINFNNKMDDNAFMISIRKLPKNSIVVLEDIDALFKARKENDEYKNSITFSALLNTLDGLGSKNGLIVFMTTNYECNLDSALKRPGRIDKSINFTYANKDQVKSMFDKFYPEKTDEFNKFYKLIKKLKFTTALLQQYFIWYMDDYEQIYNEDNIEEFKNNCEKYNYDTKVDLYS